MNDKPIDHHNAVSELPNTDVEPGTHSKDACNFCGEPAKYYGKTKNGLKGYMCGECCRTQSRGQAKKV